MIHLFSRPGRWAPLPLRAIVGYGFLAHGLAKLANGPERFIGILDALGVPAPVALGWATICVEIAGGIAVMAGAFVLLFSAPMATILIVAAITTHWQYGFSSIKLQAVTAGGAQFGQPGYETDLLYLACLAALVLGGSGPFSVDALRRGRPDGNRDGQGRRPGTDGVKAEGQKKRLRSL